MTKKLEKVTGPVMKTVFFEHANLNSLSDYLIAEHGEALSQHFDLSVSEVNVVAEAVAESIEHAAEQVKQSVVNEESEADALKHAMVGFLAQMIADETRRDVESIEADAGFEGFGIDSFLALRMTKKLEKVTGPVMKTVFFEHANLNSLSEYLIAEHRDALSQHFDLSVSEVNVVAEAVAESIEHAAEQVKQSVVNEESEADALKHAMVGFLAQMIADETRRDVESIEADAGFEGFGIDSFLALRMTKKLEKVTGPVMKTVFFEHANLNSLSDYLIAEHGEALTQHFLIPNNDEQDVSKVKILDKVSTKKYAVLKETDITNNSEFFEVIKNLCDLNGKENKALARNAIAPYIFLGSSRKAYFNFNHNGEVAIAFTYVGKEEDLDELAVEFTNYCRENNLLANMLTEKVLTDSVDDKFSSNPFGLMQRIPDIQDMSLRGSKMRRLRYQINKFQQTGVCEFFEYESGQDALIDKSIAVMIDEWAETKNMVNPYIWEVKKLIAKGQLPPSHRIFLTKIDNKLQNVIILTELSPRSGYLMDLEFYAKEIPLGGLEFSIWNIIQTLSEEGHQDFSLGATFGVSVGDAQTANPAVTSILASLQEQGAFDGKGNMQFKNKFRPDNRTLYISRPMSDDAQSVVDVIMLIANPYVENKETLQSGK